MYGKGLAKMGRVTVACCWLLLRGGCDGLASHWLETDVGKMTYEWEKDCRSAIDESCRKKLCGVEPY